MRNTIGFITDRSEIAISMNILYPTIEMDIETPTKGWDDVFAGNKVRIPYPNKDYYLTASPEIYLNNHHEDYEVTPENITTSEYFLLTQGGWGIHDSFGYSDVIEIARNNQTVIVNPEKIVCVVFNMPKARRAYVRLMKITKVDPHCSTVAKVVPLTEEELADAKKAIKRVLRGR